MMLNGKNKISYAHLLEVAIYGCFWFPSNIFC